jgi:hypothetical protein
MRTLRRCRAEVKVVDGRKSGIGEAVAGVSGIE